MVQIELDNYLCKFLYKHIKPVNHAYPGLRWQTACRLIGGDICVVAQELNSRYLMVICGLDQHDLRYFPELFARRMSYDLIVMCRSIGLPDNKPLRQYIKSIAEDQFCCKGADARPSDALYKLLNKLERHYSSQHLSSQHLPLSMDEHEALAFTFPLNSSLRGEGPFSPAEVLAERCRLLVAEKMRLESEQAVMSVNDNIVTLDFSNNNK